MPRSEAPPKESPRARRQRLLACAVRDAAKKIAGTHQRQNRQEWAASRIADGFSRRTVEDAIAGGPLAVTREAIRNINGQPVDAPARVLRAMQALAIIDTQRELQQPREHGVKPHRSGPMPPRLRPTE